MVRILSAPLNLWAFNEVERNRKAFQPTVIWFTRKIIEHEKGSNTH